MIVASSQFWWFASRSSGIVLWLVVAASILWGFSVSSRLVKKKGIPAWMLDLHKHLGTLALVFTAVHLAALWADSWVEFGWRELFVPMASTWQPGAVAWGVVAFWLLVVIQVTSWFMKHLPRKVWHTIHLLSVPLFVTGTAHGILAGADWGNRLVQWGLLMVGVVVVWLATFRMLAPTKSAASVDRLAAARAASAAAKAAAATGAGADEVSATAEDRLAARRAARAAAGQAG